MSPRNSCTLTVGLGGDVMLGRSVNELLGSVPPAHPWGDVLPLLRSTDINLINLESAFTASTQAVDKACTYKADPHHTLVLQEGHIDAVNLANNHVMDFGVEGMLDTLSMLDLAGVAYTGAGRDLAAARRPAVLDAHGWRVGILGFTDNEPGWKAGGHRPGTRYVPIGDIGPLVEDVATLRDEVDILILSMHWGLGMAREPQAHFVEFAHSLIDLGVDIFHGHGAHVFQGLEVYKGKPIFFDTGGLIGDYDVDPNLRNDQSFFSVVEWGTEGLERILQYPIEIKECQARRATEGAAGICGRQLELSQKLGTTLSVEDGVVSYRRACT